MLLSVMEEHAMISDEMNIRPISALSTKAPKEKPGAIGFLAKGQMIKKALLAFNICSLIVW